MPKIPQASFSQGMSLAVDAPQVSQATTGQQRLDKSVDTALGVVMKIQDMNERTDAYQYAQNVRSKYDMVRLRFEDGLANSDSEGNYQAVDENGETQTRNINTDFMEMEKIYTDGIKDAEKLSRGDIAGEVLNKDIGDELIRTNIRTSRTMARKKTQAVRESTTDEIQRYLSEPLQASMNGEDVRTSLSNALTKLDSRLEGVREIVGDKDYKDLVKIRNGTLERYASELIQGRATSENIRTAVRMLDGISDDNARFMAKYQFERTKANAVLVTQETALRRYATALEDFQKSPHSSPKELIALRNATRGLSGLYTNPKYGGKTSEELQAIQDEGMAIMGGTMAFKDLTKSPALAAYVRGEQMVVEDGADTFAQARTEYVTRESSRDPSSDEYDSPKTVRSAEEEVVASVDAKLSALGVSEERKGLLTQRALQQIREIHRSGAFSLAEMVQADMPNATKGEQIQEIVARTANMRKDLGPLVSAKESKAWLDNWKTNLTQNNAEALTMLEQIDRDLGMTGTGAGSYNYRYMQDIVGKNREYSYLTFLSTAPTGLREAVIAAKRDEAINEDAIKLHEKKITKAEGKVAEVIEQKLGRYMPSQLKEGMVQSIRALGIRQGRLNGSNFDKGMERAMEMLAENAVIVGSDRVSVFIPNAKGATDYTRYADQIRSAADYLPTLPMKSYEEKRRIVQETLGINPAGRSDIQIDAILDGHIKIIPDVDHPGVHIAATVDKYNNTHEVLDSKGNRVAIHADELIGYAQKRWDEIRGEKFSRVGEK